MKGMKNGLCFKSSKGSDDKIKEYKNDSKNGITIGKLRGEWMLDKIKVHRVGHLERIVQLDEYAQKEFKLK